MRVQLIDKDTNAVVDDYITDYTEPKQNDIISMGEGDDEKVFIVDHRKIYKDKFVIICYGKLTKMSYLKNSNH